jgi:hypothetical protein
MSLSHGRGGNFEVESVKFFGGTGCVFHSKRHGLPDLTARKIIHGAFRSGMEPSSLACLSFSFYGAMEANLIGWAPSADTNVVLRTTEYLAMGPGWRLSHHRAQQWHLARHSAAAIHQLPKDLRPSRPYRARQPFVDGRDLFG